jgi:hypothetical protein
MIARAKALIPQCACPRLQNRGFAAAAGRDRARFARGRPVSDPAAETRGGSEFDYVALVDCADAIGQADASAAWNFANLASHHWMLAMFDKRAQDLVWNKDVNALIASSFIFPAGRARKVDGGYVLRAAGRSRRGLIPANGICWPASCPPMTRPTASSTGSFCSTRATTPSKTPGTRPDCAAPDRTTSKSTMPSWPNR